MKKLAPVLVLALALVWIAVRLLGQEPAPDSGGLGVGPGAQDATAMEKSMPRLPDAAPGLASDNEPANQDTSNRLAVDTAPEPSPQPDDQPGAIIRGRFLFPDGTPAPGVTLEMRGFGRGRDAELEFGLPKDWQAPEGETDGDGNFELKFEAPRAYQYMLNAKLPGYSEESWRWGEIMPTEVIDVGTLHLRNTGTLEGFVVDAEGNPMKHTWTMYGYSDPTDEGGEDRDQTQNFGFTNRETGAFRLEDVAVGPVELSAHSQSAGWLEAVMADIKQGETTTVNLTYDGPDITNRIALTITTRPYHSLAGGVTDVRIAGQGIDKELTRNRDSNQILGIEDLEDGLYTATIDDERFVPWIKEGMRPGERATARLKGSAGVQLTVHNDATGEPLTDAQVFVGLSIVNERKSQPVEVHPLGPLPDGGLLPGIPSGERGLLVVAPGFAPLEISLGTLLPGELRPVTASLLAESSLGGTAHYPDGTPAPGIEVILMPPGAEPAAKKTWSGGRSSYVGASHTTHTDAAGKFHFPALLPGTYDVHGINTPWLLGASLGQVVTHGEHRHVDLELPRGATLEVTLTGLVDELPPGFAVYSQTKAEQVYNSGPMRAAMATLRKGQAELKNIGPGKWLAKDLAPGNAKVTLGQSTFDLPRPGRGVTKRNGYLEPLGEVELEDGRTTSLTVDLADRLPGKLTATVYSQGEPAFKASVTVYAKDYSVAGTALTGPDGVAEFEGLFPGPHTVKADLPNGARLAQDSPVVVTGETTSTARLDFFGYTNTIRCTGPGGELLPNASFTLNSSAMNVTLQSRPNSEVEAFLNPGEYTVYISIYDQETEDWVTHKPLVTWPANEGETVEFMYLAE